MKGTRTSESRFLREKPAPCRASIPDHLVQHVFLDVDWQMRLAGDRDGDGVGGAGIDFDDLAIGPDAELCEVGMVLEIGDDHVVEFAAQALDNLADEVVRERPRRSEALHAAVDHGCFEQADENGEGPLAVDFFQIDDLVVVDFADNDPREFHRDGHDRILAHTKRAWYSQRKAYYSSLARRQASALPRPPISREAVLSSP